MSFQRVGWSVILRITFNDSLHHSLPTHIPTVSAWMSTPSVIVDETRLQANISRMQALATAQNVKLRPHIKTHKTAEIALLQLEAGACGLTASKPSEALAFFHAGISSLRSILLAYTVVNPDKLTPLVESSRHTGIEFRLTVDSLEGVDAIEEAAKLCNHAVKLLIHVDVGYHRVGVDPTDTKVIDMAKRIRDSPILEFTGILSHAGHVYACNSVEECSQVAEIERALMVELKEKLEQNGVKVPEVSVGSTLTEPARRNFDGITEIRPGNYVFLDRTPIRMGMFDITDVALTVLVTVVSSNKYHFIVDAGSKVLSSDVPQSAGEFGSRAYGLAFYDNDFERVTKEPSQYREVLEDGRELHCFELVKLSEEHGWITHVEGLPSPRIGDRLVILPNHACVTANLANTLYVKGSRRKEWQLISRGCTQ